MRKRRQLPPSLGKLTPQRVREDRLAKYEHEIVKFVLNRYGLRQDIGRIEELATNATGVRRASFAAFEQLYPFPLILRVGVFDKVEELLSVPYFLGGKFSRSDIVRDYYLLRERWPDDPRPLALVFRFPHLHVVGSATSLALHDLLPIDTNEWADVCVCLGQTGRGGKELLVVEPLLRLLEKLDARVGTGGEEWYG